MIASTCANAGNSIPDVRFGVADLCPNRHRSVGQRGNVSKTAFTVTITTGLSLIAIVVGSLMFAYGEGQSKKTLAGIVFGVGMAIDADNSTEMRIARRGVQG